ncbi:thioredoxin family protein [Streptomyces sp. NPDC057363]|uniref:thioredoxin family protein n=1 Tax=Streptomyces sp. NPDC057363 TaxID=3346107 RepID=UPI0036375BC4
MYPTAVQRLRVTRFPRSHPGAAPLSTIELTADNFDEVNSGHGFVITDFRAEWRRPRRTFGPVFEQVPEKHEGVVFAKVDTEAQRELAQAFEITSILTLVIVREHTVFRRPGALPEAEPDDLINQARSLDMDALRAALPEPRPTSLKTCSGYRSDSRLLSTTLVVSTARARHHGPQGQARPSSAGHHRGHAVHRAPQAGERLSIRSSRA